MWLGFLHILVRLITTLAPELPSPCTIWRQQGNREEKETGAQDKQRPVLCPQLVARPSPPRHGAHHVQTTRPLTAAQLNLQPRRWICCQWAPGGKRKDPRGGKGLCHSLEAPQVVGCTPASFSKVTKWATTCFPQWESEQSLLSVTKLSAAIIHTSYTTVSLSRLSFILGTKGGAFTSEHQKTTQGFWWNSLAFQILMTSWQFSQPQCANLHSPLQRPALSIFCGCQLPSASLPVSGSLG